MNKSVEVRPYPLAGLIAMLAALAGLIGFSLGAGAWQGKVNQILIDHDRRLNVQADWNVRQDNRDNRQDAHMETTDRDVAELKTTLGTISYQVGWLVRRLRASEYHPFGGGRRPSESED